MQHTVNASLLVCLSEKGFSLDELVWRLRELFEQKAHGEILRTILLLVEETLKLKVMQKAEVPITCACGHAGFALNGRQKTRRIRTSLGDVRLPGLSRAKCDRCAKTHTLLLRFLGVERHQSKTAELEQQAIEQAVADSYRRAAGKLEQATGTRMAHSTLHGWILDTKADQIDLSPDVMGSLPATVFADGTKYKGAGSVRGDIKAMIGITAKGEFVPLGTWTGGESWKQVAADLKRRSVRFPTGTVLVADAESGLAEYLAEHADLHQRCQWHTVRDLYHAMWKDGGAIGEIRPVQDALKVVLGIELPKEDFELVPESEKDHIEARMEKAEEQVLGLVQHLAGRGFRKAAAYLDRSRRYMFSYVRRWLQFGIACPRASSLIERFFRELGRRVKKLGYNWKAAGVGKITRIILKKCTRPEDWKKYWEERMRLDGSVQVFFRILNAS
jgi:hypothetical protein